MFNTKMLVAFLGVIMILICGMAQAGAAPSGTLSGTYKWKGKDQKLEGVLTPDGDGKWTVKWTYDRGNKPKNSDGAVQGDLINGQLSGNGSIGKRGFKFDGQIQNGTINAQHYETTGNKTKKTGTLVLKYTPNQATPPTKPAAKETTSSSSSKTEEKSETTQSSSDVKSSSKSGDKSVDSAGQKTTPQTLDKEKLLERLQKVLKDEKQPALLLDSGMNMLITAVEKDQLKLKSTEISMNYPWKNLSDNELKELDKALKALEAEAK